MAKQNNVISCTCMVTRRSEGKVNIYCFYFKYWLCIKYAHIKCSLY